MLVPLTLMVSVLVVSVMFLLVLNCIVLLVPEFPLVPDVMFIHCVPVVLVIAVFHATFALNLNVFVFSVLGTGNSNCVLSLNSNALPLTCLSAILNSESCDVSVVALTVIVSNRGVSSVFLLKSI